MSLFLRRFDVHRVLVLQMETPTMQILPVLAVAVIICAVVWLGGFFDSPYLMPMGFIAIAFAGWVIRTRR